MSKEKKDAAEEMVETEVSFQAYQELKEAAKASADALMTEVQAREQAQELLEQAEQKADELQESFVRLQAEFDNYRKRTQTEMDGLFQEGIGEAIRMALPMIDNLERAYDAAIASGEENISKGIKMCLDQFTDVFAKKGMEEIPSLGEEFDPNVHEAIMQEQTEDDAQRGKICEVLQKGYTYKGKVLRYSVVKVYA